MKDNRTKHLTQKEDREGNRASLDWVLTSTLRVAQSWFVKLAAYCAAIAAAVVGIERLPDKLGLSNEICAVIVLAPIAFAFLFHTIPAIRERRIRNRLKLVSGTLKAGYFQLGPRQDEEGFDRADRKHIEIYLWLKQSPKRLLYLVGASGAGKSSLLTAWVIPKLEREKTVVIRLRGFQDPASALEGELNKIVRKKPGPKPNLSSLLEAAHKTTVPFRLLIVFDQFEEFLILKEGAERERFLQFLIAEATMPSEGVSILLVFRDEYDGFIQQLKLPVPIWGDNFQKVSVFTEAAARDFLLGSGLTFDETLQSQVLLEAAEVEGTRGLIRPITVNLCGLVLSRFVTGLPRQFRPGHLIRGFVREAVFQPNIAEITPFLLPKLISQHLTRTPRSIDDLTKGTELTCEQVRGVMFRLGEPERAIVRPLDHDLQIWEISHDFLVPIIDSMLARWRQSSWKRMRKWLPLTAATIVLAVVFLIPRFIPDPITALTLRGWITQPATTASGGKIIIQSYNIYCNSCTTEELAKSAGDLRRIGVGINVTLTGISSFDSAHLGGWATLNVKSLALLDNEKLEDISAVTGLHSLESLSLQNDPSLRDSQLKGLPDSLTSLILNGLPITDAAISYLPRGIEILDLGRTHLTDAAVPVLPPDLASLNLSDTDVTDRGIRDLPKILQHLELRDTKITDEATPFLPRTLTSLDLKSTAVTDEGLQGLPPGLQLVDLTDTKVTKEGLKKLPKNTRALNFHPIPAPPVLTGVIIR